jgi:tape measure domain-containing protein|nr:MAG TPA: tail tape measure protein [Caudoviricetes sp.]
METQGTIGIKATLDVTEMQRNAQKYLREIDAMQDHTDVASRSVATSFSRIQAAGAAYLSWNFAKQFVSQMTTIYGEFQQLEIKFTSMLQSGEKAQKLMRQLVNFAATTPFDLKGVSQSATQLVAYGTASEDVIDKLTRLGNIAAGLSQPIGDLVYLYGTSMTQGKLMTQDLNQFAGRGVPIFTELAKVMGVNKDEVRDLAEQGKISFSYLEKVVDNLTNKGGMFFNLMSEQSKAVTGKISNLGDNLDMMFNELGQANDGFINGALDGASYLVEHYKEVGTALMALVAVYGIHKAALIANAAYYGAIKRTENITMINAEAQALKALETEEIKANLTKQGLTVGSLDYNKALKAEILAKQESQAASQRLAATELATAQASYKAALKRSLSAKDAIWRREADLALAKAEGNQTKINLAQSELQKAIDERSAATKAKKAAAITLAQKASASEAATNALNTTTTTLNTAGEVANTAAKSLGVRMTNLLTAATARLNAVLAANVWTIAALGIAAVGYGIYELVTYQTNAEKAQEKLNKRVREFNSETKTEQIEIDRLFGKLDAAKKGTEEYEEAKQAIIDKYGEYLKGLGDEKTALNDVAKAYDAISAAAKQAAIDRAISDAKMAASDTFKEQSTKHYGDLEKAIKKQIGNERDASALYQNIVNELNKNGSLSEVTSRIVQSFSKSIYRRGTDGIERLSKIKNPIRDAVDELQQDIRDLNTSFDEAERVFGKKSVDYLSMTSEQIQMIIDNYEKDIKAGKESIEITLELPKAREALTEVTKKENKSAETVAQRKVRWTKELTEAEKKLSELKADNSTATEKEIKSQQELVDGLKKKLGIDDKSLSKGNKKQEEINHTKVENAERQRQIDELNQQNKDKAIQAELELAQAVIDAKDEGFLKEQAQIELNYKKAQADNARRANEYVKAAQQAERLAWEKEHPDYKDKGEIFTPTTKTRDDLSPENKAILESYDKAAFDAKTAGEKNLAKSLLETYQDYTDQRLAIEKKFNDDIEALRIQREKYAKEGDTEKVQQTDRSIAQATTKKGESLVNFDYEQLKKSPEYVYAFENLKQTSSATLNSLLTQLEDAKQTAAQVLSPDQLREYTSTIQSIMDELTERNPFQMLADRKKELAEAEIELAAAKKQLEEVKAAGGKKLISSTYNKETGKIEATYLTASEAMKKYNKAQDKVVKKTSQVREAEKKVTESFDKLFSAIQDVGGSIGGLTGEIISMIGGIGSTVMTAIQGLESASKASSAAIQTVEKASVILAIISAAIQLATKVASFFAADYSDYNKAKEAYESYVEVLDTVIEKQKELVETLTGENAKNAYEYALELIDTQADAARELGKERLNAGASAGSHSIGVRIRKGMSGEGWNQAKKALGSDFDKYGIGDGRMTGLFDLSVEQLEKLRDEAPLFWAKLDGDVKDYLNAIIESGEKIEEMNEAWKESLTNVSFDSVYEDFLDTLYDMDADSQDFAKSFADYMRKAMIKSMFDKNYKAKLEEWYDLWAKYMDDGVIDDDEQRELDNLKNSIVSGAKAGADLINDQFKDIYQEGANREAAEKKGITASQDSIDEFNGRITATNMMVSDIVQKLSAQYPLLVNISSVMDNVKLSITGISVNMSELKELSRAANNHLANIENNTAVLKDMQKDMIEVKRGIERINDKGIKLLK